MNYDDLFITTENIPRTAFSDLPFWYMVVCTRTGGWELWNTSGGLLKSLLVAGEFADDWLVLDADGTVIVDSRPIAPAGEKA